MKVVVLDREVGQNLSLFKHLIHRESEKAKGYFQVAKKAYHAFIHRKTGLLRFEVLEKKGFKSEEWVPIIIQLRPNKEGAFEVLGEGDAKCFDCSKLEPKAYALLTKTMHILNQVCFDPKHGRNPFWILRHVAHIDFLLSEEEEGEKNFIENALHPINRYQAENLLRDMAPGTYLFRKDEYTQILEDGLNQSRAQPVMCITLTYRDWEGKIVEKIIVYVEGKWLFYDDDLELEGPKFRSARELLGSMEHALSRPLLVA